MRVRGGGIVASPYFSTIIIKALLTGRRCWYKIANGNQVQHKAIGERLREFEALCRQRGLPVTVQRRAILEAVLERNDHPSADQIYEAVQTRIPAISRTTVYRVLETLVELGVVRRVSHPGAMTRYDGRIHRHHHLICVRCSKVIDFESAALDKLPLPKGSPQGFEIEDYSVHFTGTCPECRKEKPGAR